MAGEGLSITNFNANVQNLIKENGIDVDKNGKINSSELSKLLATAGVESNEITGIVDSFKITSGKSANIQQAIEKLENAIELIQQGKKLDENMYDEVQTNLDALAQQVETSFESGEKLNELTNVYEKVSHEKYDDLEGNYENRYRGVIESFESILHPPVYDRQSGKSVNKEGVTFEKLHALGDEVVEQMYNSIDNISRFKNEQQALLGKFKDAINSGDADLAKDTIKVMLDHTNEFSVTCGTAMNALLDIADQVKMLLVGEKEGDIPESVAAFLNKNIEKLDEQINSIKEAAQKDKENNDTLLVLLNKTYEAANESQDFREILVSISNLSNIVSESYFMTIKVGDEANTEVLQSFDAVREHKSLSDNPVIKDLQEQFAEKAGEERMLNNYRNDAMQTGLDMLATLVEKGAIRQDKDEILHAIKDLSAQWSDLFNTSYKNAIDLQNIAMDFLDYIADFKEDTTGIDNATTDRKPDKDGFVKCAMQPFGVVLMNKETGEIKSLSGAVIKPARQ